MNQTQLKVNILKNTKNITLKLIDQKLLKVYMNPKAFKTHLQANKLN